MKLPSLGLIGFGQFGQFMARCLKKYFDIVVYDRKNIKGLAKKIGVKSGTLAEVSACSIVVLAIPVQYLEDLLKKIKGSVIPGALIVDVSSVKVRPIFLMKKYLPKNVDIIGLHPLFGPQSGSEGIKGLRITVCPVRGGRTNGVINFLKEYLELKVFKKTPKEHDREVRFSQALAHFIARALETMDIPDVEQKTVAYQYLLNMKKMLGSDSWDLFVTIENENPYAAEIRKKFLAELIKIEKKLK